MSNRWYSILAVAVILLGAGLRLPHLGKRSLWLDEAVAANNSSGSLTETLGKTRAFNSSPIVYPLILWAVEKLNHSALSVRLPSFVSSVCLIALVLWPGKKLLGAEAAVIGGLLIALAPSYIHYAQEVREYALGSLLGVVMGLAFMNFLSNPTGRREKLTLWAMLALAPLVQYGLVLFGGAILLTMTWIAFAERRVQWRDVVVGGAALGVAGLLSFLCTLRYQYRASVWSARSTYLEENLFTPGHMNPVMFLYRNVVSMLDFFTPGWIAFGIVALGLGAVLVLPMHRCGKDFQKLLLCLVGVAVLAALAHAYPIGNIRQCLYLGGWISVMAAVGLDGLSSSLGVSRNRFLTMVAAIVAVSAASGIVKERPYDEQEDSKAVFTRLGQSDSSQDDVYIYCGARPALEFYFGRPRNMPPQWTEKSPIWWPFYHEDEGSQRFIFGGFHRDKPEEYSQEILSAVRQDAHRLWLVFSHIEFDDDRLIVEKLRAANPTWVVEERLRAKNAALYEASRSPN